MSKVRVAGFAVSVDGFGAGVAQSLENPLGIGGAELHRWFFPTQTFQSMFGKPGETEGEDARFARASAEGFGAFILGRNMFGPIRGPWLDEEWKGWWGSNPPYHASTFILTHHPRDPIVMEGGTTFHFVTDGIERALAMAREAAGKLDVKIGGGVATVRQYLLAGAIDEMHLVVSPILLGQGEFLLQGIDLPSLGYRITETVSTERATHLVLKRD